MRLVRSGLVVVGFLWVLTGAPALPAMAKHGGGAGRAAISTRAMHRRKEHRTIHGIVVDEKGRPVAGAHVHAAKNPPGEHHGKKKHETKTAVKGKGHAAKHHKGKGVVTDSQGRFTLEVGAKKHYVVAHDKGKGKGFARIDGSEVRIVLHKHHQKQGHKGHHKKA